MSQDMASPAVTLGDRLTSLSLGVDPASGSLAAPGPTPTPMEGPPPPPSVSDVALPPPGFPPSQAPDVPTTTTSSAVPPPPGFPPSQAPAPDTPTTTPGRSEAEEPLGGSTPASAPAAEAQTSTGDGSTTPSGPADWSTVVRSRPRKRSRHTDDASSDAGGRYKRSRSRKGASGQQRTPPPPPEPTPFPIFHPNEPPDPIPTSVPLTGPAMRSVIAACLPEFVRRHWAEGMPCPSRQCVLPPPPKTVLTFPAAGARPAPAPGFRVQGCLPTGGLSLHDPPNQPSGAGQARPDQPPRPHLHQWGVAGYPAAAPRRSHPEVEPPTHRRYGENPGESPSTREGDRPCTGCQGRYAGQRASSQRRLNLPTLTLATYPRRSTPLGTPNTP